MHYSTHNQLRASIGSPDEGHPFAPTLSCQRVNHVDYDATASCMPRAPTLDSEMGASREGATGVPGERTWLAGVGNRSRSSTLPDALRRDPAQLQRRHPPRIPIAALQQVRQIVVHIQLRPRHADPTTPKLNLRELCLRRVFKPLQVLARNRQPAPGAQPQHDHVRAPTQVLGRRHSRLTLQLLRRVKGGVDLRIGRQVVRMPVHALSPKVRSAQPCVQPPHPESGVCRSASRLAAEPRPVAPTLPPSHRGASQRPLTSPPAIHAHAAAGGRQRTRQNESRQTSSSPHPYFSRPALRIQQFSCINRPGALLREARSALRAGVGILKL